MIKVIILFYVNLKLNAKRNKIIVKETPVTHLHKYSQKQEQRKSLTKVMRNNYRKVPA